MLGIAAVAPDSENVADPIDGDFQPRILKPGNKLVTSKLFRIRGSEADKPAFFIAADRTERVDASKEPRCIDEKIAHPSAPIRTSFKN
ncbi:hypothetical protein [Sinorhizobium fredii]|uniref:hypothetical protein n=1 Tax=Rhizobium fredii TaxID=380 RepID=UPI000A895DE1|nr:hypothetical protein [Sinorhizobium fredii]WOS61308.1 hypothetical protein SFGR64A_10035 [Sinorhizobium fredii GR64]